MKAVTSVVLALPCSALAGTSDPAGIATLVLWGVVLALGLWALLAFALAGAIAKSWSWRATIGASIAAAPLAYCSIDSHNYDKGLEDLRQLNTQLSSVADSYLLDACSQHRRALSNRQVDPSDGVLVNVNTEQKLDLRDAPPPEKESSEMQLNQKRYGESNPLETHSRQYVDPIYWVRQIYPDSVLRASKFLYVEDSRGMPSTVARKHWWLESGYTQVADRAELDRSLQLLQESDNHWHSQNTIASTAKYELTVADISTTTDRANWVARGQVRLTHRETGEIVAEYIGFAANRSPAYRNRGSYSWERASVCPGRERQYEQERSSWNVVEFFFHEVVQYKSSTTK